MFAFILIIFVFILIIKIALAFIAIIKTALLIRLCLLSRFFWCRFYSFLFSHFRLFSFIRLRIWLDLCWSGLLWFCYSLLLIALWFVICFVLINTIQFFHRIIFNCCHMVRNLNIHFF